MIPMFFEEIILGTEIDLEPAFDNDGSYMVIYQNTVLSTRYYGVEFENEDAFEDWFN